MASSTGTTGTFTEQIQKNLNIGNVESKML